MTFGFSSCRYLQEDSVTFHNSYKFTCITISYCRHFIYLAFDFCPHAVRIVHFTNVVNSIDWLIYFRAFMLCTIAHIIQCKLAIITCSCVDVLLNISLNDCVLHCLQYICSLNLIPLSAPLALYIICLKQA